jgi:hypothetical protein
VYRAPYFKAKPFSLMHPEPSQPIGLDQSPTANGSGNRKQWIEILADLLKNTEGSMRIKSCHCVRKLHDEGNTIWNLYFQGSEIKLFLEEDYL